jgi:glycosyltransferase involved in cell wall biosynthesis
MYGRTGIRAGSHSTKTKSSSESGVKVMKTISGSDGKKCILFINLYTEMGGGEYALYYMLREMNREKFHPVMVFSARGPFVEKVEALGVTTVILPYPTVMLKELARPTILFEMIRSSGQFYRYFKSNKIDVIHCCDVLTLLLVMTSVLRFRIPLVYNVIFFHEWNRMVLFNLLAIFLVKAIVTNSLAMENDLKRKTVLLNRKVSSIYYGIDTVSFRPLRKDETNSLKKSFGVIENIKLIGMAARFDPTKGHKVFLQTASILLQRHKDLKFLIIGGLLNANVVTSLRQYHDEVMMLLDKLQLRKDVILLDHRDDMPEIMRSLDVFVCPSLVEPFGLVVPEAIASGVPVVVSRSVGALEVTKHLDSVFTAETNDERSFVEGIEQALQFRMKSRDALSRNAEEVLHTLTWRAYAQNFEHYYTTCAGRIS